MVDMEDQSVFEDKELTREMEFRISRLADF